MAIVGGLSPAPGHGAADAHSSGLTLIAPRLDITPTASEIPRAVGMVVNRPAGGAAMRVSAR